MKTQINDLLSYRFASAPRFSPDGKAVAYICYKAGADKKSYDSFVRVICPETGAALAMRAPQHIGYFFVREDCQRRGIGKKLFETMRMDYTVQEFTVNAAPYAVGIYRRLGFVPTDTEKITNGIRYTPMRFAGGNSDGVV